jgi:hypothetical protein
MSDAQAIYGLLAEFPDSESLTEAARRAREAGYRKMEAYSPFPIEELPEALGYGRTGIAAIVFTGGVIGALGGFFMQYYATVIGYPLNVGGRPLNSWPVYMPVTFELTVLVAAVSGVIGLFLLSGLPMPYHPLFNVPRFGHASQDGFFLCIETEDPKFDREVTKRSLRELGALEVTEVPR